MANENLKIDENSRWVLGAVTNDSDQFIKNVRINPITGALVVEANVTSTNTQIGSTIPGGTAGSVLFLDIGSTLAEDNNYFFYDPTNHRLALGHKTPTKTLDLLGTLKYRDGSQSADYVLISDSAGNATWDDLANNATFVTNLVANTTFTTDLANNANFYNTLANNNSFISALTSNTTFINDVAVNVSGSVAVVTDATLTGDGTTGNPLHVVSGGTTITLETNGTPNGDQTLLNLKDGTNITITDDGIGGITIDATDTTVALETNGTPNGDQTLLNLVSGTNITLTDNGTGSVTIDASGGGSGDAIVYSVNQTAHGLSVGDVIKSSGVANEYDKAQADSAVNAEVVGIVTTVTDVDNFIYSKDIMGFSDASVPSGTPGEAVFLDPSTPGAMTLTEPTTPGDISKPVGVLIGSNKMNFTSDYRGQDVQATPLTSNTYKGGVKTGTLNFTTGGTETITHNLGIIPKMIKLRLSYYNTTGGGGGNSLSDGNAIINSDGSVNSQQCIIYMVSPTVPQLLSTSKIGGMGTNGQTFDNITIDNVTATTFDLIVSGTTFYNGNQKYIWELFA